MKESVLTVKSNDLLSENVFRLTLSGDVGEINVPGQFVNISVPGFYLRRPISVSFKRPADSEIDLIYKVAGHGTKRLSEIRAGAALNVLTGLGNGFNIDNSLGNPLVVAGGLGAAPMNWLVDSLLRKNVNVTAVLGFNTLSDIFLLDELKSYENEHAGKFRFIITTVDGSFGVKGLVTDALNLVGSYSYYYACGPMPMLKTAHGKLNGPGEYSLEERMGCGFGTCMCCSVRTTDGSARVCRDGPVFAEGRLIWDD